MSPDPINTNLSLTTSPPPEPPSSNGSSPSASAADRGNHELMVALKRTLTRLGIDASTGLAINDGTHEGALFHKRASASSASLIAALYQALKLHQAIASENGPTPEADEGALSGVSGAQNASTNDNGYRDLSAQIADLANLAGQIPHDDAERDEWDEWDWGFSDPVATSSTDTSTDESDPMMSAIAQLNQALQNHVAALSQDSGASVPLAAVLDGLSKETKSIRWRPVGALIDVQA
ncbi:hypothetical protein [Paraburkholderia azotifigens]|uniref:Uncharacterized protein n=1 Tax=Paraburkholderia azotifigens TaxID=2057004 RepID=A0A5C6VNB3_9BURK|nr:hypothetical protein [Paraburkholderia azotifigens]TXC84658.1 hypothetical protein FRZ40_30970 [Paraburkholderia azotifigens]